MSDREEPMTREEFQNYAKYLARRDEALVFCQGKPSNLAEYDPHLAGLVQNAIDAHNIVIRYARAKLGKDGQ